MPNGCYFLVGLGIYGKISKFGLKMKSMQMSTGFSQQDWAGICCELTTNSWKHTTLSATKELRYVSWNQKAQCHVPKSPLLLISRARWILSIPPHPTSLRPILISFYGLRLGILGRLFLHDFSSKYLGELIFCPMGVHTLPTSPSLTWLFQKLRSSCSGKILQRPVTSPVLEPNTLLNTLVSNSLSYVTLANTLMNFPAQ
jgi:hypothetical protein